jgi:hypothetical protein
MEDGTAVVDAAPPFASGRTGKNYRLKIIFGTVFRVWEFVPGTLIPSFCPGRHINGDKSFCLGLERFECTVGGLVDFWGKLRAYLLCQQFADVHGRWPTGRGLSHGNAAYEQIEAETYAKAAGLERCYRRAIEFGIGRLAGDLTALSERLAAETATIRPRRNALRNLVSAEIKRRAKDAEFLGWSRMTGNICCNTMRECPMRTN